MGRRWFDDLTGDDLADDDVHALAVTLDGDPLAVYDVGTQGRIGREDLLADLGVHLTGTVKPVVACGHVDLPNDMAAAVQTIARLGDEEVAGRAVRAEFFAAVDTVRSHWCTHAAPLDPGPLDESAEDAPSADHDEPSPQVSDPTPVDESAENDIRPSIAQPVESPRVETVPEPLDSTYSVGPVKVGEAKAGAATDATIRRWTRDHGLVELPARKSIPLWLRGEYERLRGEPPDFNARALARREGATPTTPDIDPGVATLQTIHVWCLRNGVEDRLPPTPSARGAYIAAWRAAHPEPEPPVAGTSAAGEDPPTPDRAGPPGRASGRSNGTRVPDFPGDSSSDDGTHYADDGCDPPHVEPGVEPGPAKPKASVRPVVEPIGDGTGQPTSTAKQLERADELAAAGKTPKQICSETGVWLSEARAAVRKANQR